MSWSPALPRRIRWHLFQVLLIGILPIGLFAGMLMVMLWSAQEEERGRTQLEAARTLAGTLDKTIESTILRLSHLATLPLSSESEIASLRERARSALALNPDWRNIILVEADGTYRMNLLVAPGEPMPPPLNRPYLHEALATKRPALSDVFTGRVLQEPAAAVGVPILRGGTVTHVLIASFNLAWFDLLTRQRGPSPGGINGIFDRNFKFVARSVDGDKMRGSNPSPGLTENMKKAAEGIGKFRSLAGYDVYSAWTRANVGWYVVIATPAAPVESALYRYLILFGGGWLLTVVGGLLFAAFKGRGITSSLRLAESSASNLASGNPGPVGAASAVTEIASVLRALEVTATRLERAQLERDNAFERERSAREAAESSNRAKDEFLAMLGHELRNPLAAITNAIHIINQKQRTPEQVEFAGNVIGRQAEHLRRLVDDLLDVGRVTTGKILLDRQPLDLHAAADHVVSALRAAGRLARHRVSLSGTPAWVNADATRIEQIIANLVVNAVTYTPAGGEISVHVGRDADNATVAVADNGIGIPPEMLPRIFDLFFQGKQSADRPYSGMGIGLTLVKRLVELHGGTVGAESAGPGRGSRLTVRLPAVAAPAAAPAGAPAKAQASGQKVLVVEDNADVARTLRLALEVKGAHRVWEAQDGPSGLALAAEVEPLVAIIDIGLPGMDGYEVARRLRERMGNRIALIALTGYGRTEDQQRALESGFDRHLTKPADFDELDALIQRYAARQKP